MHCRIRINGHLDRSWRDWLGQLEIVQEETGTTLLHGHLEDQAALYGVLLKIRDLGLVLISFERSQPPEDSKT